MKTRGYGVHAGWGPSGWFTEPELAGGGALVDMGVHAIDTARFLLGDPEPGRVCATIGTRYADGRYDVDDDGVCLIAWANGTNSRGRVRLVAAPPGRARGRHRGLRHRRLRADLATGAAVGRLRALHAADVHARRWPSSSMRSREGRQPRPSGEDGRVVMQVVEEAYRSAGLIP